MREEPNGEDSPSAVSASRPVRWVFRDIDGKVMPCACPLSPWGSPPTPLLPAWYLTEHADTPLPDSVRSLAPNLSTVGDLGAFWDHASEPVAQAALSRLVNLVGWTRPDPDEVIVPGMLVEDVVHHWPLRVRTRNCLERWRRSGGEEGLTVGTLMGLPAFGVLSLFDIMCVAEAAGQRDLTEGPPLRAEDARASEPPNAVLPLIGMLLAAVSDFQPAETVGDALRADLGSYMDALGISLLDDIDLRELTGGYRVSQGLVNALGEAVSRLDTIEQAVLDARLFTADPRPFSHVGWDLGIDRERVRRLADRIAADIDEATGWLVGGIVALLERRLGHVTSPEQVQSAVTGLFDAPDEPAAKLARRIINHALSYTLIGDRCFDRAAVEAVNRLKQRAETLADDVGLVDEDALWSAPFLSGWTDHRAEMEETSGLVRVEEFLAHRNTTRARIKAALHHIGRPATRQEIADLCGVAAGHLGKYLSGIPSAARAGKDRWGLAEWMEDVYEGIPSEIRKRVEQGGGEVPLESLLEELPERFGVQPDSVMTYAGSPQFEVRDGQVSLADPSAISLRPLDEVISGRDEQGNPYWDFEVRARYFEGYSLLGVPPEIAGELGCGPGHDIKVSVASPSDTNDLSVIWRLSSVTRASIGYLSQPLRMIGAEDGDRVRITLNPDGTVSLHLVGDTIEEQQAPPFG